MKEDEASADEASTRSEPLSVPPPGASIEVSRPGRLSKHKIGAISSCVLWVLSILLSFAIPGTSPWIWLPDATLLIGFFPLLFAWSPSWPWLVFGVLTLGIGFLFLVFSFIADSYFPVQLHAGKHHLEQYHPWWIWVLLGAGATIYGAGRMTKNIASKIIDKSQASKSKQIKP